MNSIFCQYMTTLGQRFKHYSVKDPYIIDYGDCRDKLNFIVTELSVNSEIMRFYEIDGHGFLIKKPSEILPNISLDHKKFVENFGVIIDQYGYKNKFMQNLVDIFFCDKSSQNMEFIIEDFQRKCKKANMLTSFNNSIFNEMIIFAYEANGNCFLYDNKGQVYFYGMDHAYNELTPLSGCPEYTLYKIPTLFNLNSFISTLIMDKQ